MIGINFHKTNENKVRLIHYKPETVDNEFDLLVESLPEKDPTKSDMRADLYRDENDNLFWEYNIIE